MDIMETVMQEDMLSLKLLLNQYKKELDDLNNNIGPARVLSQAEVTKMKDDLKDRIRNLEKALCE